MGEGTYMLPGARALEPLKQGNLDGLCGLYSIINAIRLASYRDIELPAATQHKLFKRGIAAYGRRRSLAKLIHRGMGNRAWAELCAELVSYCNRSHGTDIAHRLLFNAGTPLTTRIAMRAIKGDLDTGYPVLICLRGAYNHYTVVSGYRLGRLILFDSGPYHWIATRTCGTKISKPHTRHRLRPSGIIALSRTRLQPSPA